MLVIAGALFVAWQLHRRAAAVAPDQDAALSLLAHQRRQLVRQRDACLGVGRWYLLPFVPGLALMVLAPAIEGEAPLTAVMAAGAGLATAIVALVFAGIWWLNRRAARTLQSAIGEIDALSTDAPRSR